MKFTNCPPWLTPEQGGLYYEIGIAYSSTVPQMLQSTELERLAAFKETVQQHLSLIEQDFKSRIEQMRKETDTLFLESQVQELTFEDGPIVVPTDPVKI